MAEYLENIELAENILNNLSTEFYPNLYRVFFQKRGELGKKLRVLLEYIREHGILEPEWSKWEYCTTVSIRQLMRKGGGSASTWGGLLAQLTAWGLLKKEYPQPDSWLASILEKTEKKQRKAQGIKSRQAYPEIMMYHIPAWTAEVLQRAEELAGKYIPAGTCTRTTARDLYGERMAASMYPDGRQGIAKVTQRIRDGIDRAVQDRIRNKGYFYPNEIPSDVRRQRIKYKGQEIRKDHIRRVFKGYLPKLAEEQKLRHGRPTAEELSRYGIPAERKREWIYRPAEE